MITKSNQSWVWKWCICVRGRFGDRKVWWVCAPVFGEKKKGVGAQKKAIAAAHFDFFRLGKASLFVAVVVTSPTPPSRPIWRLSRSPAFFRPPHPAPHRFFRFAAAAVLVFFRGAREGVAERGWVTGDEENYRSTIKIHAPLSNYCALWKPIG